MHHWLILHPGIDASWQKNAFGYLASTLVLCSFSATSMRALRCLAIASNLSFIIYATISGLMPILILHGLLLPMNIYRLAQIARLPNAGVTGDPVAIAGERDSHAVPPISHGGPPQRQGPHVSGCQHVA